MTMKRVLWTAFAVLVLLVCAEAAEKKSADEVAAPPVHEPPVAAGASSASTPPPPVPEPAPAPIPAVPESTPATKESVSQCSAADEMSPRERLAQLLVVGVDPGDPAEAIALVRKDQIGGIFIGGKATDLFRDNALAQVQQAAQVPVSVAVDDEGGRVQRIRELEGSLPSAREMARTMTPEQVRKLAEERGRALSDRGVTVNYAPDVDLTDGPAEGAIGDRSFSADPAVARKYAMAFAKGLADGGIQPVLKHFPGHGRADGDSHAGLVSTPPLPELRGHDLLPYERIEEYGDNIGVMVGHLEVPGLTEGDPASLSEATYELLREEFQFDGPVLTDDLGAMRAVTDRYPLPEAVLRALQAGADQPLWSSGGQVGAVLDRLEQAVANGELRDERVREALDRVLLAKGACG